MMMRCCHRMPTNLSSRRTSTLPISGILSRSGGPEAYQRLADDRSPVPHGPHDDHMMLLPNSGSNGSLGGGSGNSSMTSIAAGATVAGSSVTVAIDNNVSPASTSSSPSDSVPSRSIPDDATDVDPKLLADADRFILFPLSSP
jgi:hypothetical protein